MNKSLNDVQVGDRITAMGDKEFDSTLEVTKVERYKEDVVLVVLAATGAFGNLSPFWPMQPGRAAATEITVAS